jgi:hypothetical protein
LVQWSSGYLLPVGADMTTCGSRGAKVANSARSSQDEMRDLTDNRVAQLNLPASLSLVPSESRLVCWTRWWTSVIAPCPCGVLSIFFTGGLSVGFRSHP